MNIPISTSTDEIINCTLSFDPYGNVYFVNDQTTFQINIDNTNKPYADSGSYYIISDTITNKLLLEPTDNDDDDKEDYVITVDEEGNEIMYDDNPKFIFHSISSDADLIQINERENGDITSLYDTEIYNVNNTLIFKAISEDSSSIYKLKIYLNGKIFFGIITNTEREFKLSINNTGQLIFI